MEFTAIRGEDFEESFDFKSEQGKPIRLPTGRFRLVLSRWPFIQEYLVDAGLAASTSSIKWRIPAGQVNSFEYSTMYFTLYLDDKSIAQGTLRVQ